MIQKLVAFLKENKLLISVSLFFVVALVYFLFAIHVLPLQISHEESNKVLSQTSSYIKDDASSTKLDTLPTELPTPTVSAYINTKTVVNPTKKPVVATAAPTAVPTAVPTTTPTPTATLTAAPTSTPTTAPTATQTPAPSPTDVTTPVPTQ